MKGNIKYSVPGGSMGGTQHSPSLSLSLSAAAPSCKVVETRPVKGNPGHYAAVLGTT